VHPGFLGLFTVLHKKTYTFQGGGRKQHAQTRMFPGPPTFGDPFDFKRMSDRDKDMF
jgi:hypothetical protein